MKKLNLFIFSVVLILFCITLNINAYTQMSEEQIKAFRSAKTVRIEVDQSYGKAEGISLPFEKIVKILLGHAGLLVAGPDAEDCDLQLTIVARGQALSRYYKNVEMSLYTGASLSGSIVLRMQGKPIYTKTFKRIKEPPTMFYTFSSLDHYKNPSYEIFSVLLTVPSPIILTIMEVIGEVYGSNVFIKALREKNGDIRHNAREALVKIGTPSVKPLIAVLKEKDFYTREEAIRALGMIKDSSAVEPLISVLKDDPHLIRWGAVDALGEIMDYRAVEPLIATLNDENSEVKKKAIWALKKITMQDFGEDKGKWSEWWRKNKGKFLKKK